MMRGARRWAHATSTIGVAHGYWRSASLISAPAA
jgi:hypothetical protein